MKRIIFILALTFLMIPIVGQDPILIPIKQKSAHQKGDFSISAAPGILFHNNYANHFAGSLKLKYFVGDHFSFNSDFVVSKDYIHFGPAMIGLPLWYLSTSILNEGVSFDELDDSFILLLIAGALILLSVENFAYHLPVGNHMEFSPYISLLRFRQASESLYLANGISSMESMRAGGALGFELNKYFNKFVVSPYAEFNFNYKDNVPGFYVGIHCGYYLRK